MTRGGRARAIGRPAVGGLLLLGVALGACVSSDSGAPVGRPVTVPAPSAPATTRPSPPPVPLAVAPVVPSSPEWRPGDRWLYDWKAGADSGSKTVEVIELKEINRVRYYVTRIGELDHYFTMGMEYAASTVSGKVRARMVPPQPWFTWPLEVGRRWTYQGFFEDQEGRKPSTDSFAVVAAELVEVPAGRFSTLKVVREGTSRDSDEYWYASEVHFYVKWVGRRGDTEFEENLREYRLGPRLIPAPATPALPPR